MVQQVRDALEAGSKVMLYLLTLLMGVVAYQGRMALNQIEGNSKAIAEVSERVTRVESNRSTEWLREDIREIKESMRELQRKIESRDAIR